jgi:hypothetical protein
LMIHDPSPQNRVQGDHFADASTPSFHITIWTEGQDKMEDFGSVFGDLGDLLGSTRIDILDLIGWELAHARSFFHCECFHVQFAHDCCFSE